MTFKNIFENIGRAHGFWIIFTMILSGVLSVKALDWIFDDASEIKDSMGVGIVVMWMFFCYSIGSILIFLYRLINKNLPNE